jgi:energy-coupling factor transporter ATP-binding protein EcfA2
MSREIYINDFANFNKFKIHLDNYNSDKLSLNLLVGKNGSGKSSFLDALFQIAMHNLKGTIDQGQDFNTALTYSVRDEDGILLSNIEEEISRLPEFEYRKKQVWDKVIRFYTGSTSRKNHISTETIFDINTLLSRWIFPSLILSGNFVGNEWEPVFNILSKNKSKCITPRYVWIKSNLKIESNFPDDDNMNEFEAFLKSVSLSKPDITSSIIEGDFIHLFDVNNREFERSNPLGFYRQITSYHKSYDDLVISDCGFIYTYGNDEEADKFPDDFLSDGEHALLNRFALISMLQKKDEKYLVLLDEPETHFNEYWKTEFLYLITETLKECKHDIFIATHSAMLVTDAKKDEIHRFENRESGTIVYPTPINTFGVNVVDIGKALFQMESDIGKRSQYEIEDKIKKAFEKNNTEELNILLREVGPGEWRWKIRTAIKEIKQSHRCKHFERKEV